MNNEQRFAAYPHDPDQIQEQLDGARASARRWRETTQALWLAAFALKQAAQSAPCPEARQALELQVQEAQQRHQAAVYSATLCDEAAQELQRRLPAVVDANLVDGFCDHEASGAEMGRAA
jgi:hypothetical protein